MKGVLFFPFNLEDPFFPDRQGFTSRILYLHAFKIHFLQLRTAKHLKVPDGIPNVIDWRRRTAHTVPFSVAFEGTTNQFPRTKTDSQSKRENDPAEEYPESQHNDIAPNLEVIERNGSGQHEQAGK